MMDFDEKSIRKLEKMAESMKNEDLMDYSLSISTLIDEIRDENEQKLRKIIEKLPEFTLKEGKTDEWNKIKITNADDDYSWATVEFADHVMKVSEALSRAEVSEYPTEIFSIAEQICDFTGLTGFQAGAAHAIMRSVWAFSDRFPTGA